MKMVNGFATVAQRKVLLELGVLAHPRSLNLKILFTKEDLQNKRLTNITVPNV